MFLGSICIQFESKAGELGYRLAYEFDGHLSRFLLESGGWLWDRILSLFEVASLRQIRKTDLGLARAPS